MSGEIKKVIDQIVTKRSKGNPTIAKITRTKLLLKGVDPDKYDESSPYSAEVMQKLCKIADEFNLRLDLIEIT